MGQVWTAEYMNTAPKAFRESRGIRQEGAPRRIIRKSKERRNDSHKKNNQQQQTPWPQSASDIYRLSGCLLSEKLMQIFADRGVSRSQRN
jgi:hypothetical protein